MLFITALCFFPSLSFVRQFSFFLSFPPVTSKQCFFFALHLCLYLRSPLSPHSLSKSGTRKFPGRLCYRPQARLHRPQPGPVSLLRPPERRRPLRPWRQRRQAGRDGRLARVERHGQPTGDAYGPEAGRVVPPGGGLCGQGEEQAE